MFLPVHGFVAVTDYLQPLPFTERQFSTDQNHVIATPSNQVSGSARPPVEVGNMRRIVLAMLLCLCAPVVFVQLVSAQVISGIVIKESSFDPQTKTVKLTFINDRAADITAWTYCVHVTQIPAGSVSRGSCTSIDTSISVIDRQILLKEKPKTPEWRCSGCNAIHPGQELALQTSFGNEPEVVNATIEVVMVVFSDGTWSANEQGKSWLQSLAEGRRVALQITQQIIAMGTQILNDPKERNPAFTMLAKMKNRSHLTGTAGEAKSPPEGMTYTDESGAVLHTMPLDSDTVNFMRPDWRKGDNREYMPANQAEYLRKFIAEQQIHLQYFTKNQISNPGLAR